jgi:4-cresol dehydrogenase (hydroxylating)
LQAILEAVRPSPSGLAPAIAAWREALGVEFVVTERAACEAAQTTTFCTDQKVPAILRPANREEVQECLRIANRFGVPVYPVSSGLNWGYGSRVPDANGCALLELMRMNRIVDFREDLAYVTVEPGVTQAQLYRFLQERGSKLWMDATGGSPDSSLIGNTVERGFGHTPYGDHFASSCAYEIVLPNGDFMETGFARFGNAQAAECYAWGTGPVLDGLFTQSNFGIVTRMTVWLMPAPEYFQAFYFRVDDDNALAEVVNALRPLRMNGTLRSAMHIANDYKVMASMRQYPYEKTGGQTPLRPEVMKTFRKELSCGAWNGSGALYGTRRQVSEARRLVKRALAGKVNKIQFLDDFLLKVASRFAKPLGALTGWDLSGALELVVPVYGLTKGIPTSRPLQSCYWRHPSIPAKFAAGKFDLDAGDCGLFWCAPVAPADGEHTQAVVRIVYDVVLSGGFEPMLTITLLTERSASCVVSIAYDRRVPGEDEKAQACYQILLKTLAQRGYYSYRLGIQGMKQMEGAEGYNRFVRELKNTIDPNNILSPGRYSPPSAG